MYNKHFGFREKPFKLVPNPEFLYLSKIHEIALAHLTYAVEQGDGFVVITGEVGTGKTTLCRMFLEKLDEKTESAYIFNPKLDSVELLTTICNEFGIRTNHSSLKQLLDVINGYLIMKSKADRKVILLIDEAQNLSIENLEMVRMLSNLETTRNKLLQIILVGQPELGDKLDSYELRQLSQRISLSTHLTPLSFEETVGYIRHRVNIAAQRHLDIFTKGACRLIHRYSNGTPRMINIACDRALLNAFGLSRVKVTAPVARLAIDELTNRKHKKSLFSIPNPRLWGGVAAGVLLVFAILLLVATKSGPGTQTTAVAAVQEQEVARPDTDAPQVSEETSIRTYKIPEFPVPDTPTAVARNAENGGGDGSAIDINHVDMLQFSAIINNLEHDSSRFHAVVELLEQWGQTAPIEAQLPAGAADSEYIDIAAHQYSLRMYTVQSDWAMIKKMNLPAIIAFRKGAPRQTVYMTMLKWQDGYIHLAADNGEQIIKTRLESLLPHLNGPVYIYWKDVIGYDHLIAKGAPDDAITMAKDMLRRIGYTDIDVGPSFNNRMRHAIMDFQMRHSLEPDGLIGPLTKIFLIVEAEAGQMPKLNG